MPLHYPQFRLVVKKFGGKLWTHVQDFEFDAVLKLEFLIKGI
jgi:hypothetical protein